MVERRGLELISWMTSVDATGSPALRSFAAGLRRDLDAVIAGLSQRAGRTLGQQTYKQHCGEFYSASAVGFAHAVELARTQQCGVLLYTLSLRGGKALCCVEP